MLNKLKIIIKKGLWYIFNAICIISVIGLHPFYICLMLLFLYMSYHVKKIYEGIKRNHEK